MSDNILESGKALETLTEDSYTDAGSDHTGAWSRVPGNRGMFKTVCLKYNILGFGNAFEF